MIAKSEVLNSRCQPPLAILSKSIASVNQLFARMVGFGLTVSRDSSLFSKFELMKTILGEAFLKVFNAFELPFGA